MEEENQEKIGLKTNLTQKYIPFIWEVFKVFIIASVIVLPIRYFLFQPFIVKGDSMVPNFQSGDYLIIDELSYRFSNPERGDVIVFKYPKDTSQRFIKRVVGLPGETVQIRDGNVYIISNGNTTQLDEKYLPENLKTSGNINVSLGQDQYFVLGDNREYSFDSRVWGLVLRSNIIGKTFLRVLPLTALTKF